MIRDISASDKPAVLQIIKDSNQFNDESLAYVESTLDAHLAENSGAIWLTADDGQPVSISYCNPEPVTLGTWNLLMLWTRQDRQGQGFGTALVAEIEHRLREKGARLLIVETSGLPDFEVARAFYAKCGFVHEATIKDFFAAGEDKLIYTKPISQD